MSNNTLKVKREDLCEGLSLLKNVQAKGKNLTNNNFVNISASQSDKDIIKLSASHPSFSLMDVEVTIPCKDYSIGKEIAIATVPADITNSVKFIKQEDQEPTIYFNESSVKINNSMFFNNIYNKESSLYLPLKTSYLQNITPEGFNINIALSRTKLLEILTRIKCAMADKLEVRECLKGVYLEVKGDGYLTIVTADGRRMARENMQYSGNYNEKINNILIPADVINFLMKLMKNKYYNRDYPYVYISFSLGEEERKNERGVMEKCSEFHLGRITMGDVTIYFKGISNKFPNYQQVMPSGGSRTLLLNREEFIKSLELLEFSLKSTDDDEPVCYQLYLSDYNRNKQWQNIFLLGLGMTVKEYEEWCGRREAKVVSTESKVIEIGKGYYDGGKSPCDGNNFFVDNGNKGAEHVGVSIKYTLDILKSLKDERIIFRFFWNVFGPFIIERDNNNDDTFLYLCMPIRLKERKADPEEEITRLGRSY